MKDLELLRLYKCIYSVCSNADDLNDSYIRAINDLNTVKKLTKILGGSIFYDHESLELKRTVEKCLSDMFDDPNGVPDRYIELEKGLNRILALIKETAERLKKCTIYPDKICIIDKESQTLYKTFFQRLYAAHLYCIFRLEAPNKEKNIIKRLDNDVLAWIDYFKGYDWKYINDCIKTWTITFVEEDNRVVGSRLIFHKGVELYNNLRDSDSAKSCGDYMYYIGGDQNPVNMSGYFGIGNISNIKIGNIEGIFNRKLYFDIPMKYPEKFEYISPIEQILSLLPENNSEFCISPYDFYRWLNYCISVENQNNGKACPICGRIINNNTWMCGTHFKLL